MPGQAAGQEWRRKEEADRVGESVCAEVVRKQT